MQTYVVSPTRTAPVTEEHPLFRFDVSTLVCSSNPIKMVVLGDTKWTSLIHVDMTDAELDELIAFATVARSKRRGQKAETLTMLAESEYDDGAISMETAERLTLLGNSVLADREDAPCDYCGGSGQVGNADDPESCNYCRGTGRVPAGE